MKLIIKRIRTLENILIKKEVKEKVDENQIIQKENEELLIYQ